MIIRDCRVSSTFPSHLSPNVSEKHALMIVLASICKPHILQNSINRACQFECNPARNPTDRFVHDQPFGVGASDPSPCGAPGLFVGHRNWCALNSWMFF